MPNYDFKCPYCGYATELFLPITYDGPVKCQNPKHNCDGVMEKQFTSPPQLHNHCIPSRISNDGVTYKHQ